MKKALLVLMIIGVIGCASLKEAMQGVTAEQQSEMTAQVVSVAGPFIPQPYQIPATALLGWFACVGYNWFKKKTSSNA